MRHAACCWAAMSQGHCCSGKDGLELLKSLHASSSAFSHTPAGMHPMVPTSVAVPGKSRQRFVLIPPPPDRTNPLCIVDMGKAAEVIRC